MAPSFASIRTGFAIAFASLFMVSMTKQFRFQQYWNAERNLLSNNDPLRVAVFGSSNSWGAQLDNRFQSYPYRLSPTVDNFAYFASGPNYPAVCTQSVVGDDSMYDLILLEYYVNGAEHGLADLARRLRERFPEAIIIIMKFYGPFDAVRREDPEDDDYMDLNQWKKTLDLVDGDLNTFVKAIQADTGSWKFRKHPNSDHAINRVVREIGGYQFHLPKAETPKKTLISYLRFFDKDKHMRLSERGHEYVYDMCKQIVTKHILRTKANRVRHIDEARVNGSWGSGDSCNIWKTTGGCRHKFSSSLDLKQYDVQHGKFALEVNDFGWMEVKNPFDDDRVLYLSFIASGNESDYPDLQVDNGDQTFTLKSFVGSKDKHMVGIVRTLPVGSIPGGESVRLTLTPTNLSGKENPFRLVGTTFTNNAILPVEYGFGPNFNV